MLSYTACPGSTLVDSREISGASTISAAGLVDVDPGYMFAAKHRKVVK